MNFCTLCRSCMKELQPEELGNFDQNIVNIFTYCTNITVNETDILPKNFCVTCINCIKSSYNYIRHAQEVNETFKNLIVESGAESTYESLKGEDFETKIEIKLEECLKNEETDTTADITFDDSNSLAFSIEHNANIESAKCEQVTVNFHQKSESRKCKRVRSQKCPTSECNDAVDFTKQNPKRVTRSKTKLKNYKEIDGIQTRNNSDTNQNKEYKSEKFHQVTENISEQNLVTDYDSSEEISSDRCPICLEVYDGHSDYWIKNHLKICLKRKKEKLVFYKTSNKRTNIDKEKLKPCTICYRGFLSDTWLKRHIEKEHTGVPQIYYCPFCPKTFKMNSNYYRHKRTHEEGNKFQCNVCEKRFRMRRHLAVHALVHSKERPFICDKCHMSFKMKHVLVNHLKLHENKKAFLCSICGRSFVTNNSLRDHMLTHTSDKPIACPQPHCAYRCKVRSYLMQHMLTHTDETKVQCNYCQKPFRRLEALRRHIRIHTGEKPYKCPSCPQAFIDSWKRKMHLIRTHQCALENIPRMNREGQPISL